MGYDSSLRWKVVLFSEFTEKWKYTGDDEFSKGIWDNMMKALNSLLKSGTQMETVFWMEKCMSHMTLSSMVQIQ